MRDNKLMVLVLVFFLVLGAFSFMLVAENQSQQIRASQTCASDPATSFIISTPKDVPPGGACAVTVVSRCADETVVVDSNISLTVSNGTATPNQGLTDGGGLFESAIEGNGLATIQATVDGQPLQQSVTCNFQ